jgi:4-amino-4-deoxy-L-arabinose transferase-like glycosyltransferase
MMPTDAAPRRRALVVALVLLAVAARTGVVLNRAIDPDESQHLHVAWRIAQGQVPYRDFWEHHLPAFHGLMAPLTAALTDRTEIYFAGRVLMAALAGGAVLVTWRIARRLSGPAAAWAVAVLLVLPQFAETSTETRPDVPALLAHLLSLLALLRWREGGRAGWLWAAGAWQGLALSLSIKAVLSLAGVAAAVASAAAPGFDGRARLAALLRLAGGAAVAPIVLLAALAWSGGEPALRGLVRDVLQGSLGFVDRAKTWPVYGSELAVFGLALIGVVVAARLRGRAWLRHPVHGTLLTPTLAVAVGLALPTTPAVYQHAWLPVLPVAAIYAGVALATLREGARVRPDARRAALVAAAVVGGLLVPAAETARFAVRNQNAAELRQMREALVLACPGEPVLDGTALAVFRPAAHRYAALVRGVREWVARGMVAEETIEADLRAARARVALPDKRFRAMVGPVAWFFRRHYVPHGDGVWIAGAEIAAAPGGGRAVVELLADGWHRVTVPAGTRVAVDRVEVAPGWRRLSAGRHEVTWRGRGGTIRIAAGTCPERRSLPGPPPPGGSA